MQLLRECRIAVRRNGHAGPQDDTLELPAAGPNDATTCSCSRFQRAGSPRKAVSADPGIVGSPSPAMSWSRP